MDLLLPAHLAECPPEAGRRSSSRIVIVRTANRQFVPTRDSSRTCRFWRQHFGGSKHEIRTHGASFGGGHLPTSVRDARNRGAGAPFRVCRVSSGRGLGGADPRSRTGRRSSDRTYPEHGLPARRNGAGARDARPRPRARKVAASASLGPSRVPLTPAASSWNDDSADYGLESLLGRSRQGIASSILVLAAAPLAKKLHESRHQPFVAMTPARTNVAKRASAEAQIKSVRLSGGDERSCFQSSIVRFPVVPDRLGVTQVNDPRAAGGASSEGSGFSSKQSPTSNRNAGRLCRESPAGSRRDS